MPYPSELILHQTIAILASLVMAMVGCFSVIYGLLLNADYWLAFVAVGGIMLLVGLPMAWMTYFWYRRAVKLTRFGQSLPAEIILIKKFEFDSNSFYVELTKSAVNSKPIQFVILTPKWDYKSLLNTNIHGDIFIEKPSSRLMAISTTYGMIWCIPNNIKIPGVQPT